MATRASKETSRRPCLQGKKVPPKEKIRLTGPEATMLPMVYFRALDAKKPNPILGDPYAQKLLDRCDIDFSAEPFVKDDRFIEYEFLDSHCSEPVTVIHLGCGLDCRYMRMRKGPNVRWIDVDHPVAVEARTRLVPRPQDEDYTLRTLQITKTGWTRDIPNDRPTLVIAEGLLPYMSADAGERVFRDVAEYFQSGEIAVDHVSSLVTRLSGAIKVVRTGGARLYWGVDNPREEIEALHPKLKMKECLHWADFMDEHPPLFGVTMTKVMGALMPGWKSNLKLLRFEY
ncbi:Tetracenomycin polyketide synthesis O-methyltransferase TcmP [Cytospora mali]|uniref:Tetracenomycin polyketide synthesis O-methyltransferase TcmP n=1 Tax=Cytospora mali TaxID=578113 RepID=A0A194V919_CYTMA|nr:Tetracenomycin polyketide synthesis O-methyltransferase TcmP [Valsa mali var. pyri (nom. inval.)]